MNLVFGKKIWILLVAAAIITLAFFGIVLLRSENFRYTLIRNQAFQRLVPSYRSLRKLPDIVFFPYFFHKTSLPIIELSIQPQDLAVLNAGLPDPFGAPLLESNRVQVKADFRAGDFKERVDVRYRGFKNNHWSAEQKSWRINFPKDGRFLGMEALNLVIPYDRAYFIELLNAYRAKKLGLHVPEIFFVRLKLNGKDAGVYMTWEQWSDRWLSRVGLPDTSHILSVDDATAGSFEDQTPLLSKTGIRRWKSHTDETKNNFPGLEALAEVLEKADDLTFKNLIPHIVDLPKFYAWHAVRALADSSHQWEIANLILIFNTATGKFEPVPFDVGMEMDEYVRDEAAELLASRIFSIPEFRKERDETLRGYLIKENLRDDFGFYNNFAVRMRPEFLSDRVKFHSNFTYLAEVKRYRNLLESNFQKAFSFLGRSKNQEVRLWGLDLEMPPEFARFPDAAMPLGEFLLKNPQFSAPDADTLTIGPGQVNFYKTVVIPAGFKVIVYPGSSMFLGEGVSLVSYSPIEIAGSQSSPVRISGLDVKRAWGSISVLDTGERLSKIRFAEISGGSGVTINGVIATGMISVHGGGLEVWASTFSDTHDDDAINVRNGYASIRSSKFFRTHSDAIDLDMVDSRSVVEDNFFLPPIGEDDESAGGDAIDLSFSQVLVRNNKILGGCGDKGVSVGEDSHPVLQGNIIENCPIGIAVKDSSRARIFGGILKENNTAISAYQKKQEFLGGTAYISGTAFIKNSRDFEEDKLSEIIKRP